MAATLVQSKASVSTGYTASRAVTFDSNVTAGSLIVVVVRADDPITVTDNNSNTYTQIAAAVANYGGEGAMWYAYNANAGATTVTASSTPGSSDFSVVVKEFSGVLATADPLDVSAFTDQTGYTSAHSAGPTATPSEDNQLVVACVTGDSSAAVYTGSGGIGNVTSASGNDAYSGAAMGHKDMVVASAQSGAFSSVPTYTNGFVAVAVFKLIPVIPPTSIVTIKGSQTYESGSSGYLSAHTFTDVDVSGVDTLHLAFGFNRDPAVEVSGWTSDGNAMTSVVDSINASVVAVSVWRYLINNAHVTTVSNTPTFKLQGGITLGLENVDQTTPITGTPVTAGGFSTSATAAYTGTKGNRLFVFISTSADRTFTADNCLQVAQVTHADANLGSGFVGHIVATGAAQTFGATWTTNTNWRLAIIEVKASATILPSGVWY